ncbi:hypothetical protein ACFLTH_05025 [Bacteroidota bacterium]
MIKTFTNTILSFMTGIIFTIFIIMVVVVVYLFSENSRLRREVEDVKDELSRMELKISAPSIAEVEPPVTGNTQKETYLIPNKIPTKPITGATPEIDKSPPGIEDYTPQPIPTADYSGPHTYTIQKEVEVQPVTGTKDYQEEPDNKGEFSKNNRQTQKSAESNNAGNLSESSADKSSINSDNYTTHPPYDSAKWDKLEENMTKFEIKDLLGRPNQILTHVNSTTYVYTYNEGAGNIYFDENGRATKWQKPKN